MFSVLYYVFSVLSSVLDRTLRIKVLTTLSLLIVMPFKKKKKKKITESPLTLNMNVFLKKVKHSK